MKKVFALAASLVLLLSACADSDVPKETKEELSHVQFLDGEGNPGGKKMYKYNIDGLTADMSVSNSLGESVLYESYAYDEDGNMIKKDVYSETEHEEHIFTYKNGVLKTEEITQEEIKKGKKSANEDAEATEEKKNSPYKLDEYYYNEDGTTDRIESKNSDGDVYEIKRYIYDDEGRVKKERIFSGGESYLGGVEFTYEGTAEEPSLKEYVGTASSAKYSKEEMTYEGENVVKTVRYGKDGKVAEIITVEYDDKDRRSIVTRTDAQGVVDAVNKYYYENYVSLIG